LNIDLALLRNDKDCALEGHYGGWGWGDIPHLYFVKSLQMSFYIVLILWLCFLMYRGYKWNPEINTVWIWNSVS